MFNRKKVRIFAMTLAAVLLIKLATLKFCPEINNSHAPGSGREKLGQSKSVRAGGRNCKFQIKFYKVIPTVQI